MASRVEIRLSGAGGEGLLTAGKILAAAAQIFDEKHASQSQSFGPEARGGACRSEVVITDEAVAHAPATHIDVLLALTQEAAEKYARDVQPGGLILVDGDHVGRVPEGNYAVARLPLKAKARDDLGVAASASIVALGALVALRPVVSRASLENAVLLHVPKGTEQANKRALELGYQLASQVWLAPTHLDSATVVDSATVDASATVNSVPPNNASASLTRPAGGVARGRSTVPVGPKGHMEKRGGLNMAIERTLSIVKPDGVEKGVIGEVLRRFEGAGLKLVATKMLHMSTKQAEGFYHVHRERPFFASLTRFMSRGPVVVSVLEGENAIAKNRELMGATNPANAAPGTIRKDFASSIEENTAHGSDAPETASFEIGYFFSGLELQSYVRK